MDALLASRVDPLPVEEKPAQAKAAGETTARSDSESALPFFDQPHHPVCLRAHDICQEYPCHVSREPLRPTRHDFRTDAFCFVVHKKKKMLADGAWNSAQFGRAVQQGSVRLILFQAAAFSLFMILSNAWTAFFESIVHAIMPQEDDVWVSLVRALASTFFSLILLAFMIWILVRPPVGLDRKRQSVRIGKRHFVVRPLSSSPPKTRRS